MERAIVATQQGTHRTLRQIGPYTTVARMAHNSISAVYRAHQGSGGREVALRVLAPAENVADIEGFLEALKVIAALRHEYIVPVLDYGAEGDTVYIAMPYMAGGTLQERLKLRRARQSLTNESASERLMPAALPAIGEITRMLRRLAMAMDAMHAQGIIHHLLKPSNIMFDTRGQAYLSDIALSKLFKVIFSLAQTSAINTNDYSAPEQWQGEPTVPASDQYALAGVIYQLLTGKPAFSATNVYSLMKKHMNDLPLPPHYIRRDLPGGLTNVFVRAMAKEPADRYPTVTAFARDLARTVRGYEGESTDFFTFPVRGAASWQHHAFIAHSEEDIATMEMLRDDFKRRGLTAWGKHLSRPGSITWTSLLGEAVKDAGAVVLLWSKHAPDSAWVQAMLSYAHQHDKPVVVLRLDTTECSDTGDFAETIDATSGTLAAIERLAETVKAQLAKMEAD